jgi:hypothetical protein
LRVNLGLGVPSARIIEDRASNGRAEMQSTGSVRVAAASYDPRKDPTRVSFRFDPAAAVPGESAAAAAPDDGSAAEWVRKELFVLNRDGAGGEDGGRPAFCASETVQAIDIAPQSVRGPPPPARRAGGRETGSYTAQCTCGSPPAWGGHPAITPPHDPAPPPTPHPGPCVCVCACVCARPCARVRAFVGACKSGSVRLPARVAADTPASCGEAGRGPAASLRVVHGDLFPRLRRRIRCCCARRPAPPRAAPRASAALGRPRGVGRRPLRSRLRAGLRSSMPAGWGAARGARGSRGVRLPRRRLGLRGDSDCAVTRTAR